MFNSLVFDIALRNPVKKLVLKGTNYFLYSGNGLGQISVSNELIEQLLEKQFVKKNSHGGLVVQSIATDFASTLVENCSKPNEHRHGGVISFVKTPPEFQGETYATISERVD